MAPSGSMNGQDKAMFDKLAADLEKLRVGDSMTSNMSTTSREKLLQMQAAMAEMVMTKQKVLMFKKSMASDLLFIIDVTVSMGPYRDAVRSQVKHILDLLEDMNKHHRHNTRVGIVGYRDVKLTPRFEVLPLTAVRDTGLQTVLDFLDQLKFTTNVSQDFPEDVHGALEKAGSDEIGWSADRPSRTIVHIADAPGHGRRFVDPEAPYTTRFGRDDLPDLDADGSDLRRLLMKLREERQVQNYYFMHIEDATAKVVYTRAMFAEFQKACGDPAWMTEVEWSGPEEMAFAVVEAVSSSVRSSLTLVPQVQRKFEMDTKEPKWEEIEAVTVKISVHDGGKASQSIQGFMNNMHKGFHIPLVDVTDGNAARLRVAPHPFAKGSNRLVYYGRYYPAGLTGDAEEVVLKEFISGEGLANKAVAYKSQMETQTVASLLARQFNKQATEWHPELKLVDIQYVPVELICLTKGRSIRFLLMEPMLIGEPIKYNSNVGWFNPSDPQPQLQAFSHWTYEVTDKKLMVVDVQGFRTLDPDTGNVCVRLTDPAIHCKDKDTGGGMYFAPFGANTNLSDFGPEMFLHSHLNPKFDLHGPVCCGMLPRCLDWRCKQHAAAETAPQASSPFRGFKKGGRGGQQNRAAAGPRAQAPAAPASVTSTTPSISVRVNAVKPCLKAHAECGRLLKTKGIKCPNNLHLALKQCLAYGLMTEDRWRKLDALRDPRNKATHNF